jgi:hypothetical protein
MQFFGLFCQKQRGIREKYQLFSGYLLIMNTFIALFILMRRSDLYTLFYLFLVFQCSSQYSLHFQGNISHAYTEKPLKKVSVDVFDRHSKALIHALTDKEGNYFFNLPLENPETYLVRISYPGYIHKLYSISTLNIPDEQRRTKFPVIQADLGLSEKISGVDYTFLDKPLNHYYYDSVKNNYTYDKVLLEKSIGLLLQMKEQEKAVKESRRGETQHSVTPAQVSADTTRQTDPRNTAVTSDGRKTRELPVKQQEDRFGSQLLLAIMLPAGLLLGALIKIYLYNKRNKDT